MNFDDLEVGKIYVYKPYRKDRENEYFIVLKIFYTTNGHLVRWGKTFSMGKIYKDSIMFGDILKVNKKESIKWKIRGLV